jgi:lipopolysaccharide transport system ATP-binding protein
MSDSIIKVSNLSKSYLLGHEGPKERYTALRDVIARNAKNIIRSTGDLLRGKQVVGGDEVEEFWALKDVSFEVKRGEVLGIIGRNGAGKSTLLKILSRITEPTKGRIELNGRVSSLLEVGTGFHPELSGRENIFLNGAILGMTRAEIKRKFDEIVAFAEVEKFLDTPVKRYSSGMYVRLAFAVAAHLDPEILIVDEVLAVGDAEFQKKCLGKMKDVSEREGRTILLVSHNIAAIRQMCQRSILLRSGNIISDGPLEKVLADYLDIGENNTKFSNFSYQIKTPDISLESVEISKSHLAYGDGLKIHMQIFSESEKIVGVECALRDQAQSPLAYYGSGILEGFEVKLKPGNNIITIEYPNLPLAQGRYSIDLGASKTAQKFYFLVENAVAFSIDESRPLKLGYWYMQGRGSVYIPCKLITGNDKINIT